VPTTSHFCNNGVRHSTKASIVNEVVVPVLLKGADRATHALSLPTFAELPAKAHWA